MTLTGKDVPFVWDSSCSSAFAVLRASLVDAPILAFPTETGLYILDTDASNFGLGGVLNQVQNDQERVVAYCSHALRPSQRRYCTTKREMLAAVAMCIQFRSYLRGARFTHRTDHKSLVWLHRFKDTEGMMARWLHALQQFNSLSSTGQGRITVMPTVSHTRQLRRVDSAPVQTAHWSSYSRTLLINHSTLSRPVARKMLIWCRSSRERTGLLNSMRIYHDRPLFRETHSAFRLSKARTPLYHTTFIDCCWRIPTMG